MREPTATDDWSGRALSLAVTSFTGKDLGTLPFSDACDELRNALAGAGYSVRCPDELTSAKLGAAVCDFLQSPGPGPLLVHVMSHGLLSHSDALYVLGSDARQNDSVLVDHWLRLVDDYEDRPYTLFLLDVCHAGAAARPAWLVRQLDNGHKAWVIAASQVHQRAFDARLTRAAAQVIRRLNTGKGDFDAYAGVRYVSFQTVARAMRRSVRDLTLPGEYAQLVTSTPCDSATDISAVPFFRNRLFDQNPTTQIHGSVDPAVSAYVDEVLDVPHWRDRSAGYGPLREQIAPHGQVAVGCFTGRHRQVTELARWLDSTDPGATPLRVLTGGPGSGKSALLGVLVCAAHPRLSDMTRTLWAPIREHPPSVNRHLAAVHARQRDMAEILGSLGEQLLAIPSATRDWHPREFLAAVGRLPAPPVIVMDALDEAAEPHAITNDLLLPLLGIRRPDRRSLARLLVGMRPMPSLDELRQAATAQGKVMDLDTVSAKSLRRDIERYIRGLLRQCAPYNQQAYATAGKRFAAAVAASLTADVGYTRPGGFLTAALYTHHLVTKDSPISDPEVAVEFGRKVPGTVPDVLELDLSARVGGMPWLRPVVVSLAHAYGQGMPTTVIARVAGLWAPGRPAAAGEEELLTTLNEIKPYLRQSPDIDGTTIYRLFHQGLADYLRDHPFGPMMCAVPDEKAEFLRRLIGNLHDWQSAEPYVLRHGIHHAQAAGKAAGLITDAGFLIHADPQSLFPALDSVSADAAAEPARLARAVYRTSFDRHRTLPAVQRRSILMVDAARWGAPGLSHRTCGSPVTDHPAEHWRVAWATGSLLHPAQRGVLTGIGQAAAAVACTNLDGRSVAVLADADGVVRVWDLADNRYSGDRKFGGHGKVTAADCTYLAGDQAFVAGYRDGTIRIWNLRTGEQSGSTMMGHSAVAALACTVVSENPVAVSGGAEGMVRIWHLATRECIGERPAPFPQAVTSVRCAQIQGRPVAVVVYDAGAVLIWDLAESCEPLALSSTVQVSTVSCLRLADRPGMVTGGWDGRLRVWDLADRRQLGAPTTSHSGTVEAIDVTEIGGRSVVVTADSKDPVLHLWDLKTRRKLCPPLTGHMARIIRVVCAELGGLPCAISIDQDGEARVWDLAEYRGLGRPQAAHTRPVEAIWSAQISRRSVVGIRDSIGLTVWDLATRRRMSMGLTGTANVAAIATAYDAGDGSLLLTAVDQSGAARSWRLGGELPARPLEQFAASSAEECKPSPAAEVSATAIVMSVGRYLLVTGHVTGELVMRALTGPGEVITVRAHRGAVTSVADGLLRGCPVVISGGADGLVRVWDVSGQPWYGEPAARHAAVISQVAYAELDGRAVVLSADRSGAVRACVIAEQSVHSSMLGRPRPAVTTITVAADQSWLRAAVGYADGLVRLWEPEYQRLDSELTVPGQVSALAFDGEGRLAVGFGVDFAVFEPRVKKVRGTAHPELAD